jgi:hypothetical protein
MRLWQAFTDGNLLGATFDPPESWAAHLALLKVLEGDGAALTSVERELVLECTGRDTFDEPEQYCHSIDRDKARVIAK